MGYDGVTHADVDGYVRSTLGEELSHRVVIPFEPSQVRSVNAAFDPDFKDSPKLLAQQNFGDLTLSEEVEVEGTGKTVTVTQSAQKAFDRTAKRRNVIQKLRDCLEAG